MERLEHIKHDHVRPEIGLALQPGLVRARAEKTVGFLARQRRVNPLACFLDDLFLPQNVAEVAVALEPVGQFFPAEPPLTVRRRPGAIRELTPLGNLFEVTGHAVRFELELVPQPALRLDAADGQFEKRARRKRRTICDAESSWARPAAGRASSASRITLESSNH